MSRINLGERMTKRIAGLFGFVALLAATVPAQEPTLDQILKKNQEALGGAEAIAKVQTLRMASRMVPADNQGEMVMTVSTKRPNQGRTEIKVQDESAVTAFDGTTAWILSPFAGITQPQKLDDTAKAKLTVNTIESTVHSLAGLKAAGNDVELLGKEDVKGAPAYKIIVTFKSGQKSTYYLDAGTFLPVKMIANTLMLGQEMESESYPGNYRKVGGLMFAHSVEMNVSGSTIHVTYEKIEVDVPMADSIFKMPGPAAPAIKK
jgi:outer membrane lipoprotein-sorting protein